MCFRRLSIIAVVWMLAGCATTGPTKEQGPRVVQPAAPATAADIAKLLGNVQVSANRAWICLYRPSRFVGSANVYRVTVNGRPVADMTIGTRSLYPVAPGRVILQGRPLPSILNIGLALGLMEKPNIAFDVEAGKVYFVDVKTGFAGGPQFEFVDAPAGLRAIQGLKAAQPAAPAGEGAK